MPCIQSKVLPEYPRPIPSIRFDEIPICSDTVIYYESLSEEKQQDDEYKKVKRRRIEDVATAYLRGEDVYILTAQLKGPFEKGWKNPWVRNGKNKKHKLSEGQDIGLGVNQKKRKLDNFVPVKENGHDYDLRIAAKASKKRRISPTSSVHQQNNLSEPSEHRITSDGQSQYHEKLKKHAPNVDRFTVKVFNSETQPPHIIPSDKYAPAMDISSTAEQDTRIQLIPNPLRQPPFDRNRMGIELSRYDSDRAEFAILMSKRNLPHAHPPLANARSDLDVNRHQEQSHAAQADGGDDQEQNLNFASHPEEHVSGNSSSGSVTGIAKALVSEVKSVGMQNGAEHKDTPNLSFPKVGPSAQVQDEMLLDMSQLNKMPSEKMLDERQGSRNHDAFSDNILSRKTSSSKGGTRSGVSFNLDISEKDVDSKPRTSEEILNRTSTTSIRPKVKDPNDSSVANTSQDVDDGQIHDYISNISIDNRLPQQKGRSREPVKQRQKRASFNGSFVTPHRTQSSINSILKVSKVASTSELTSEKLDTGGKEQLKHRSNDGIDTLSKEQDIDFQEGHSVSSLQKIQKAGPLKGILKTSQDLLPQATSLIEPSVSSSTKPEAQQVEQLALKKINGSDLDGGDDAFDLDGAINDLGSYLGTWDPDKEASELVKT